MIIEIPDEAFRRLSRYACALDTTAAKLAARFLCGAYCADAYEEPDESLLDYIQHAWLHADPAMLDTDEGVRAYYGLHLDDD